MGFNLEILIHILYIFFLIIPLLLAVAFLTLFERKILSAVQRRRGPNVVGIFGLLQPIADGVKLLLKETIIPQQANKLIFVFSPIITFALSIIAWSVIPLGWGLVLVDINLGVLFTLAISSLSVYGILMAGWSSNSKYAFFGGLRSTAQMVSYEVSIGVIIMGVLLCTGSLNYTVIVLSQKYNIFFINLLPLAIMFFISVLAETNRAPFDLPEAEGELVAGYNVEYSAVGFALFFIAEYLNIILMSTLTILLFLGGWLFFFEKVIYIWYLSGFFFSIKLIIVLYFFVLARAALPRYRYDQLMDLGWKIFLPLSLAFFLLIYALLLLYDILPFIN